MSKLLHTVMFLATAVLGIVLLTSPIMSCVVDSNGTTISECGESKEMATIEDLRGAIAKGAITASDMAGMMSERGIYDEVDERCYSLNGAWIGKDVPFCEPYTPFWAK